MSDLPVGWEWATLGEVADTQLGKMLSKESKTGARSRPYLRNVNVQWHRIDLDDLAEMDFSEEESTKYELRKGDLLVCEGGEVGRTASWHGANEEVHFQKALHRVRPLGGVRPEYLEYVMRWSADTNQFAPLVTGSTIAHLPQRALRQVRVPVAPLAEQGRIVAAIDENLSRLDVAEASLASALKRTDVLLASQVNLAFEDLDHRLPLGDLADVRGGIQKQPKRRPVENKFPFLRVANVKRNQLDLGDVHEIELFGDEVDRYRLRAGDLLVVEGNGSPEQIGRSAVWGEEIVDCVHQNHLIRVRPGPRLDSRFLNIFWNSSANARQLASIASSTSGLYTLSTSKLKRVVVPAPAMAEQERLANALEDAFEVADQLRTELTRAQQRSSTLRRSIFAAAFSGRLAGQDPSDEPASVLLKRIATERAATKSPRRKKATS